MNHYMFANNPNLCNEKQPNVFMTLSFAIIKIEKRWK